ncbi:hypothetical protein B0H17DRAFT_1215665 [Mycena rosella]|uniref:Uncharacterized protein n=1 Tax=Mycena rosella TaxID=1033263 RepID=A0AAD7CJ07_MYCRO|nr:hypothetical protein B0H17DRAFT_1215665 [Mycena rosella]
MGRFKAWLPVKPSGNLQLLLDGDTLKFSGEVRLWNMTEDPDRTVRLWEKYVGGTNNVTLGFSSVSTATVGRYSAGWYSFNETEDVPFLSLDPTAITNMRFTVNNKLEDQGIGFAVQDSLVFSETSCTTSQNPIVGRFDVAVRDGLNPINHNEPDHLCRTPHNMNILVAVPAPRFHPREIHILYWAAATFHETQKNALLNQPISEHIGPYIKWHII